MSESNTHDTRGHLVSEDGGLDRSDWLLVGVCVAALGAAVILLVV